MVESQQLLVSVRSKTTDHYTFGWVDKVNSSIEAGQERPFLFFYNYKDISTDLSTELYLEVLIFDILPRLSKYFRLNAWLEGPAAEETISNWKFNSAILKQLLNRFS